MPNLTFNTSNNTKKVPINVNNMFYSQESYDFETEIAYDYLTMDCNMVCVYWAVDIEKTNLDSNYGESKLKQIQFKTPVEFHCLYDVEEGELRTYEKTKNLGSYIKSGKLNVYVMVRELQELNIDPRNGDYISVQVTPTHKENYVIVNDGRNNYSNTMSIYGLPSNWRKIICAPVTENSEFEN